MGQEIARRDDGFMPVPLTRALAKKLSLMQGEAILQRPEIEAREQNAAYTADRRVVNVFTVARHITQEAGGLDDEITSVSKDKPGLEMRLREVEDDTITAARFALRWYSARPL